MPSSTAKGFPYPVGSDKLGDTDVRVKALADFLNSDVGVFKRGSVASANIPASSNLDVVVNFSGGAFPGTPTVVCSLSTGSGISTRPDLLAFSIAAVSSTGFTCRIRNSHTSAVPTVTVYWSAGY